MQTSTSARCKLQVVRGATVLVRDLPGHRRIPTNLGTPHVMIPTNLGAPNVMISTNLGTPKVCSSDLPRERGDGRGGYSRGAEVGTAGAEVGTAVRFPPII